MDEKVNSHALLLEIEGLREELRSLTKSKNDLLIYKNQFDAILDNALVEIYPKNKEGRYITINKHFEKIFGVKNEDLVGLLPADVHYSELAISTRNYALSILNSGKAELREEVCKVAGDSQLHTLLTMKFPVFNGEVEGPGAVVTDISDEVATKVKLRESNALFNKTEQIGKLGHWEWDEIASRYTTCSKQFANVFDMTVEQMVERVTNFEEYLKLVCDDDRERYGQVVDAARASKHGWDIEYRRIDEAGNLTHLHEIGNSVLDDNGIVIRTVGTVQDITKYNLVLETLKEQNILLETINDKFEQAERITNLIHWETDAQMKMITHTSANTAAIFGHQPEYYIGDVDSFEKNIVLEDRLKIRKVFDALPSDPSHYEVEFRYQREDGRQVWVREVGEPMFDSTGTLSGFHGTQQDITDRKQAELALKSSENRLRLALKITKQGWGDLNVQTGEAIHSPEYPKLLGYDPTTYQSSLQSWQDSLHPDDHDAVMDAYQKCLSEGSTLSLEYRRRTKDGGWLWFNTTAEIVEWSSPQQPLRLLSIHTDITERKQVEEKLHASEQRFSSLVHSQSDLISRFTTDGILTFVSDSYVSFMGNGKSKLLGRSIYQDIPLEERESVKTDLSQLSVEKPRKSHESTLVSAAGERRTIEWIIHGLFDSNQTLIEIQSVGRDVTEVRESQNKVLQAHGELERLAHYDMLTDLPNRVLLADRLSLAMVQCQRRNQSLAVAYLDLDGFKTVNDTYGHDVGDGLLITVSQRMKEALREGDTLARIGGDEFIVVLVDLEKIEDSEPVLKRLLKAAAKTVTLGDAVMQVSASIGVTLYPQDGADADQLIRHADNAMYVAKQAGKNRYHLFDTAQNNAINILRQSIGDVRSALERCEFVLHYQPKVNMHTGDVIGVEALIRWQHPDRGLVPPLDFLPSIEGHAISLEIGEWVIDAALSQIKQWQSMDVDLPISVNISAYQLQQDNFTTRLSALLAAHPEVDPHWLELEILETSALNDIDQVTATMNTCHDKGVRFSLDDFGTGYSSLTYLRRLPAHMIKIDQSFVRDMLEDADDLAIVEGVVGLAKAFHREVIAEGVETIAHGAALLQLGCELAQGYGIARPMPADDIPEWVSSWKADDSWQASDNP